MKTDTPITFHEPGQLFAKAHLDELATHHILESPAKEFLRIRKKVDKILSAAEGFSRRLKEIQKTCPHPKAFVFNDVDNDTHQCVVCGYRRLRAFGS